MQPLGTHLSKIAGALAYGYLLLLVARLLLPALEPLATAQAIVFAVLLVAVVLNGVECGGAWASAAAASGRGRYRAAPRGALSPG